ncbi:MFS transporter [Arcanobacterium haemolyticum]|nr:MFS transporter [Arcanobacterium haemolyticum]
MSTATTHESGGRTFLSPAQERVLLWLSVAVISLIAFEALAVATAMPTVVDALDGHNLYALAMGVVLATQLMTTALAGPWSDSKGPQSCLYTGIALFTFGLVLCTFSTNMEIFVVGRAIQGLGAGLSVVPLYTLIGNNVVPSRQPVFFAAFAAAWVVPSLVGPLLAGILVENGSWRLVFGIVPVILVVAAPLLVIVTRRIPHTPANISPERTRMTIACSFVAGIALAVLQVMSGTKAGSFTGVTYISILVAAVVTFIFMKPLLPKGTYISRRGLASTVLLRGIINGTFVGTETFLPLMLQQVHGWTPTQAGIVLTISSVAWAAGSAVQGKVKDPAKRRALPIIGSIAQTVGIAIACLTSFSAVNGLFLIIGWLIGGFGIGMVFPAMTVLGLAMTRPENQGKTSSSLQLADTLGAAFCVAVAGIIQALVLPAIELSFVAAIGALTVLSAIGIIIARRVMPHPGSREEVQLHLTQSLQ